MRQFSLRSVLIAVTAICVFSAYQVHWINERRDYVLESDYGKDWATIDGPPRQFVVKNNPHYSDRGGPYLLWLFNEKSVKSVIVNVGIDDVTRTGNRTATIKRSHPALRRVDRLFPEDKHYEIYCRGNWDLEITIVD